MLNKKIMIAGLLSLLSACGGKESSPQAAAKAEENPWPKLQPALPADPEMEKKIADLLSRMSLEEKVGQMIQAEIKYATPEDVKQYHLGSILNGGGTYPNNDKFATPQDWLDLANAYYEASMDTSHGGVAIPVMWGSDAVHGHNNVIGATLFPHNIGLGAAHDPELIRRIGEATAREVAVTGIDWTFAPTVAVVRDDRWGRTFESYSEDPKIVREYARAMVEGIQGEKSSDEFLGGQKLISATKHFIGDGGTERGMDRGDTQASEEELARIHSAGYIGALGAGVQTVMASFNSWNGVRLHGHKHLLTDVLKGRLGFDGFVVGDWNGHRFVDGCTLESCPQSINAGLDMFMVPSDWKALYKNTLAQAQSGEIPMSRIDDAVTRILRVKMRAGLFERNKPLAGKKGILGSPEHRAIAREAVRKSLVLLKNNGGLLPLNPKQKILVAGDAADNIGKQSGGWTISWQGTGNTAADFPGATSIYAGIKSAVEKAGGEALLSINGDFEGDKPDVAVVVFGEEPYAEWHGDITSLEYQFGSKRDLALLKKLKQQNIPVVSIFISGRPLWINKELNASDAFVAAWLPGSEGAGVADVILTDAEGKTQYDFTGKLSFSWPRLVDQVPLNLGDDGYDPLFAYGYGLTYADDIEIANDLPEQGESYASGKLEDAWMMVWRPRAPWDLVILDEGNAPLVVEGNLAASDDDNIRVSAIDMRNQEDARLVEWAGLRPGGVALRADKPQDLSRYLEAGGTLSLDVRVDSELAGEVYASVTCGDDCLGKLPLKASLQKLQPGQWAPLSIDLQCFAERGAEFSRIDSSLVLESDGPLSLALANIKYIPGGADSATVRCGS
ncbi:MULTISPECIES: exo 1,3/1,4-beta-D-glucan glucohydrolase [unclassified Microbulbifer]|uniref:glycoside hydrolase family 3 protein n=1 Tax=unclassified Microbulbifer TaxID=2619833 RepID=UPI0027E45A1B|nr:MULTISPECIES: exo 1,3/1,4-beta-D-glucan glucohydrolase [unclassified Microbulbifer]